MKQVFLSTLLVAGSITIGTRALAQVAPMIIKAKTEMHFPDNGDMQSNNLPSETKTTIYVKGDHVKVESSSDQGNNYTFVDKAEKRTTQLTESNGRKTGYFSLDTATQKPAPQGDSTQQRRFSSNVEYVDTSKTIAGYACKKAVVTSTFGNRSSTTTVWYTTELPLKEPLPTTGFGRMGGGAMNQIKGFPMAYETQMPNGFSINYEVTKVDKDAKIDDKEFEIPKGYDIKPISEMRNEFGPGGGRRNVGGFGGPGGGGPPPGGGM